MKYQLCWYEIIYSVNCEIKSWCFQWNKICLFICRKAYFVLRSNISYAERISLAEGKFHWKKTCQLTSLFSGDPYGNRTHDSTLRGWRLNRLTKGPYKRYLLFIPFFLPLVKQFLILFVRFIYFLLIYLNM